GNTHYEEEEYEEAIQLYQESKAVNGSYEKASFNLGNALYRSGNLGKASQEFEIAAAAAFEKDDKAKAFHNVGNSFLNAAKLLENAPPQESDSAEIPDPQQLIRASIEAYKKALRNNPKDEETRYNLAYAQKLLKEGGGGGQDQQDQDQNQEEQENQENQENQNNDEGEQEQENQDKGEQEEQNEQPNNEMTKEEAEQLLEALDKNEKDLQEKLGKERVKGERIKIEKDW
ncbi:MAG: tetratricopeptide repeat protein, partial [Flavobacteriales bacterium]|nr:tetratricopeptide repeat protein [Flavobacteriales bacterium]